MELATIVSIYLIRVIIEYLENPTDYPGWYSYTIFLSFCIFRLIAIVARNYYDFHVYNFYKYVENAIRCWLFSDLQQFSQWQMQDTKRAAIINIMTKDIEAFVNGSWCFPYLMVVPLNTVISALILYSMVIICVCACFTLSIVWSNYLGILPWNDALVGTLILVKQAPRIHAIRSLD